MSPRGKDGAALLERVRRRYERTETKCPACGYVDRQGNWESATDGRSIVYHHVCPSCEAERNHSFDLRR